MINITNVRVDLVCQLVIVNSNYIIISIYLNYKNLSILYIKKIENLLSIRNHHLTPCRRKETKFGWVD